MPDCRDCSLTRVRSRVPQVGRAGRASAVVTASAGDGAAHESPGRASREGQWSVTAGAGDASRACPPARPARTGYVELETLLCLQAVI